MANISITRTELLEKLISAKARAEKDDIRVAELHRREEQRILEKFQAKLRDAMKWDWKTVKRHNFEVDIPYASRPSCPTLNAPRIERAIKEVRMDSRKGERFNLGTDHEWIKLALWESDSDAKKTVCD